MKARSPYTFLAEVEGMCEALAVEGPSQAAGICTSPSSLPPRAYQSIDYILVTTSCAAYRMKNSPRKTLWSTSGRTSKVTVIHMESIDWDAYFCCAFIEVPQSKTSIDEDHPRDGWSQPPCIMLLLPIWPTSYSATLSTATVPAL